MGVVEMSNNPPASRPADSFPSPALSLSLAGIFRDAAAARAGNAADAETAEEGSAGGRREETVEISSENSGPARSRSDDDFDGDREHDDNYNDEDDDNAKKKKRKKYHRHTAEQIREMEALFKESPHPDEKQRQQLSKQLGLHPRQVKFWFQNRRTQIKAIQERHENSLLKSEIEKLRDQNKELRETIKNNCCPNCGFASSPAGKDPMVAGTGGEQQLRIENARLRAEVEKLRAAVGKYPAGTSPNNSSCSGGNEQESRSALDFYTGIFGLEKSRIMDVVNVALEELKKMASSGAPLWIRSFETGREILNYDEYVKAFSVDKSAPTAALPKRSIEASRDTGIVFMELHRLVQSFMDANQWKEMFPCMISKAATVDVISVGEGANGNWNGAAQLMFAEVQMLTPVVGTREVYFVRYCKQLSGDEWAIVDVSVDKVEDNIDASLVKCRKRPSGCIIHDKSNGHCKVTWVEHLECQKSTVHSLYRSIVNSGSAFGAQHWMVTLQQHCERLVFYMATNVPTKDSTGVATLAGRKSILTLAQRMSVAFFRALGASSYNTWNKIPTKTGDDIRVASRKNLSDPGEPLGVILCAVSSVWLPVSHHALFEFLRDETHRHEWDIMSNRGPAESIANLAKGQDRGNAVTILATKSKENNMWLLQDTCTNVYESMVVYAPVDITSMQSVMTGCDSSNTAILASGFSILPDGLDSRPLVITSKPEEKSTEGGSLLTIAFQILTSNSPTAKLSMESVESLNNLVSCTLQKIKKCLQCEDG
ncbi:homeobox-leucine zipper protein GLABRA 2 [Ipomoea triloba]|uniref:homeobox-leucine zipper protein GLABRA 2 n=1 Tax=Ipomoea triloba TaxID=35885 RepID=UPI00125DC671|nr:homeobox-leucine zipper protein GLABRA 2 [Ipomoea triloba]